MLVSIADQLQTSLLYGKHCYKHRLVPARFAKIDSEIQIQKVRDGRLEMAAPCPISSSAAWNLNRGAKEIGKT